MIAFLLLAPMMFLAAGMSLFAGVAAMLSTVLTMVMGMVTGAVIVCGTALLGVMILIFS
jgi:type IV secretory pathway VirB2 component (pilin)